MLLWIAPILLQPLIVLAMIFRGLIHHFPVFFLYTSLVSGRDLALLLLRNNRNLYAWVYWAGEPVAILLGLAVIYEVLWHLIRSYSTLRFLGIRIFLMSLVVAILTGLWILKRSSFSDITSSIESILLLERSARLAQVGVLAAFIFLISRLGLTWKDYTSGIVAGFGVAAGLQLGLLELKSSHAISDNIFVLLRSAAYDSAAIIWAVYFIPSRMLAAAPIEMSKTDLARLDELLRRYLST